MISIHSPDLYRLEMSDTEYRDNMVVFFIAGHVSHIISLSNDG